MIAYLNKHPILSLLLIAYVSVVIAFTYVNDHPFSAIGKPIEIKSDTHSYLNAMYFLEEMIDTGHVQVLPDEITGTRLLTAPAMLITSLSIGKMVNDLPFGMMAINLIFYFLLVPILYKIGFMIFDNKKIACIATFLIITNWLLFSFGTAYLTDMGGWFFFILSAFFSIKFYKDTSDKRAFYLAVAASIVGVFFKEYGALGIITLSILTLISNLSVREKITSIVTAGAVFTTIVLSYHIWFYLQFNWSYFDWYLYNYESYGDPASTDRLYTLSMFIKVIGWIFLPGWPFFILGLYHLYTKVQLPLEKKYLILLSLAPASFAFLIWPAFTQRVAFILIPWVALVAAFGVAKIKSNILIAILLILYALVNYHTDMLMLIINMPF